MILAPIGFVRAASAVRVAEADVICIHLIEARPKVRFERHQWRVRRFLEPHVLLPVRTHATNDDAEPCRRKPRQIDHDQGNEHGERRTG